MRAHHGGRRIALALSIIGALLIGAAATQTAPTGEKGLAKAEKLVKDQHWAEARAAYDAVRDAVADWKTGQARKAVQGGIACSMHLQLWDEAIERAQQYIDKAKGSFEEAVGERTLGQAYVAVPHQGTKQGGKYLRGQWGQGTHVSSWGKDRREAIAHFEKARELIIALRKTLPTRGYTAENPEWLDEQIAVSFDLAGTIARKQEYGDPWGGCCWWWWGSQELEEDSAAIEDADYEQPRHWGWGRPQGQPTGIPVGPDGKPVFIKTPAGYSAALGDGPKIRFLLGEIQKLDVDPKKNQAARALYRWAMVARSLYGPESFRGYGNPQTARKPGEPQLKQLWELGDDEAITYVGGKLDLVALPGDESPVTLLRRLEELYPDAEIRPDAHYARALYFQTRQQFPRAIEEYTKFVAGYPKHRLNDPAREQIKRMKDPMALLDATGIHLPGKGPELTFKHRNADSMALTAYEFDLPAIMAKRAKEQDYWWNHDLSSYAFHEDHYKKHVGKKVTEWTQPLTQPEGHRMASGSTTLPITTPGAYLVEASVPGGSTPSRLIVLISDIAVIHKMMPKKGLIWAVDARTGEPLGNQMVRVDERYSKHNAILSKQIWYSDQSILTTNADGIIEYTRKHTGGDINQGPVHATILAEGQRMAFSMLQNWYQGDPADYLGSLDERQYVITDRPVYRPSSKVQFRIWSHPAVANTARTDPLPPLAGRTVHVVISDPKGNTVQSYTLTTDEYGTVGGELTLGEEPPLGVYIFEINGRRGDWTRVGAGQFRVEEYRKPEFEVTVQPAATQVRLGEPLSAKISARYYFGTPVAGGQVSYKVYREDYRHVYYGAGEYDWLYGRGYGRCWYGYPWLGWWGSWAAPEAEGAWNPEAWGHPYSTTTRSALRELIASGTGELDAEGTFEVKADTSKAAKEQPNTDHRYVIEAEVRDPSRRTIEGSGAVVVTRQAFYAFIEADRGWYGPQDEAFIKIRAVTPANVPVAAKGTVSVTRIKYEGPRNATVVEEPVRSWEAETDVDGRLDFTFAPPGEGQYRISFTTRDAWQQEVVGNAVLWVNGPKFEGQAHRFNELEVITDKRIYSPGDTAHLLIHTAAPHSRVLFSDDLISGVMRSYRMIDLTSGSTVVDVPVTARQVPNFFVEATVAREGRLHVESRELLVPPKAELLNVTVKPDKAEYQPGETGEVTVSLTDHQGRPAAGQVTLTAYDQAITYIQGEFGPDPKTFYYGRKNTHSPNTASSIGTMSQAVGAFDYPESLYDQKKLPADWQGWWFEGGTDRRRGSSWFGGFDRSSRNFYALGGIGGMADDSSAMAAAPVPAAGSNELASLAKQFPAQMEDLPAKPAGQGPAEPVVRSDFADTAVWLPSVKVGPEGIADVKVKFPQSLTTWRIHGYGLTKVFQVGDAASSAITRKNLLVRLQSPRFFVERDEVVLSANVHNDLKEGQDVKVELILPDLLTGLEAGTGQRLTGMAHIPAGGKQRFDWPVKVLKAGMAEITVKAVGPAESDAMKLAFPVLVHGVNKTVAACGSYRPADQGRRTLTIELPEDIDPEQTEFSLALNPSLAGVMVEALPYLVGYPYGCVEQTMSRFYPTVLVQGCLKTLGTDLETVGKARAQLSPEDKEHRFAGRPGSQTSPVFSSTEVAAMIKAGLDRIYAFQHGDGGWGWWKEDDSSPYQTAYVLQGLLAARAAGVAVDGGTIERGMQFLTNSISKELAKPKDEQAIGDLQTQTYMAYLLSLEKQRIEGNKDIAAWLDELYARRGELTNYGRSLLAVALHQAGRAEPAAVCLRNVLQYVQRDDSNETAWVRTPQQCWWFWWNNDIETNAWALRAMAAIEPDNELGPRIVKWLLNNRRNGTYWRSTRDSAQSIAAMIEYMAATGETSPDYALKVEIDGRAVREVQVTKGNLFTFDNRVQLYGLQLRPGSHEVTITKTGNGSLYYGYQLGYFTKEEGVKGSGNEIAIKREYFRLEARNQAVTLDNPSTLATTPGNRPEPTSVGGRTENREIWERIPLADQEQVSSGQLIEVVLTITAKNTYDFLAFEDFKPAGCEPVELRSGGRWAGGLCPNVELRDEKVVFFIGLLDQGTHVLRYRMRAENPGRFHALPTNGFAMYAPEVRAISDEMRLGIVD